MGRGSSDFLAGALLITLALAVLLGHTARAGETGLDRGESPRLAALARELGAGQREALAAFWHELQGQAPLVEAIAGDARHRRVTFLWRGDAGTTRVTMLGGFPAPDLAKPLMHLAGTDLWYRTETHPAEARFQYIFQVNGPEALPTRMRDLMPIMRQYPPRLDPLNPRQFAGWSYVELPEAPPQPWIKRQEGVPHGQVVHEKLRSRILNAEYPLSVYLPPGYEKERHRSWLLIAFDGGFPMMENTLDNLRAAGKIPPLVVVGVNNLGAETRDRDLTCSEPFARFLATELVPWARQGYRVHKDARHTIVGGISLGGLMADYCGLTHPDVFGKVLSQSGSVLIGPGEETARPIWDEEAPGLLQRQFARRPRLPLEFYLEAGRYETYLGVSLLSETRRLRDVLEAKGYRVTYSEFVGGHNEVCWRGSFANAVMALTSGPNR